MQLGHVLGLCLAVLGGIFSYLAFTMLSDAGATLKVFVVGPPLAAIGVSMLLFPGAKTPIAQVLSAPVQERQVLTKRLYREAPAIHKVGWAVAAAIGFALSFTTLL